MIHQDNPRADRHPLAANRAARAGIAAQDRRRSSAGLVGPDRRRATQTGLGTIEEDVSVGGAAASSVRRRLSALSSFYRYCAAHDLIGRVLTEGVARPVVDPDYTATVGWTGTRPGLWSPPTPAPRR